MPQVFAEFLDRAVEDAVGVARSWDVLTDDRIGVFRVGGSSAPHEQLLDLSLGDELIHGIYNICCCLGPAHAPAPSCRFIP